MENIYVNALMRITEAHPRRQRAIVRYILRRQILTGYKIGLYSVR